LGILDHDFHDRVGGEWIWLLRMDAHSRASRQL
jgi:hypothetical protein